MGLSPNFTFSYYLNINFASIILIGFTDDLRGNRT